MPDDDEDVMVNNLRRMLRASLRRIHAWSFDGLMDDFLGLGVVAIPDGPDVIDLPVEQRFVIYRTTWNAHIEATYDRFLPHRKVLMSLSQTPEITAYTMTLCELVPPEDSNAELQALLGKHPDARPDISALEAVLAGPRVPASDDRKLLLYLRLMNFPPLRELWKLQYLLFSEEHAISDLLTDAFDTKVRATHVRHTAPEALALSVFPLPQEFLERKPAGELASDPSLGSHREELLRISAESSPQEIKLREALIIPECGHSVQTVTKPRSAVEHDAIFQDFDLGRAVGLAFLDEARAHCMKRWAESFARGWETLNRVRHPDCLLLVEGDSEEVLLPLLSARLELSLRSARVRVHNSGGKQKVREDFFRFRKSTPNLPMVVLLDKDAQQEASDIERAIGQERDRYLVVRLAKGELEDELPREQGVAVLNRMYPDGEEIEVDDLKPGKSFVRAADHAVWKKKKVTFDKVRFATIMAISMQLEDTPESILEAIRGARLRASALSTEKT